MSSSLSSNENRAWLVTGMTTERRRRRLGLKLDFGLCLLLILETGCFYHCRCDLCFDLCWRR
ncbi:hypothetical protein Hanom_Chr14g01294661 [Helianthus anomalus]